MPIASAHLLSSYNRLQPKLLLKHVECQLRQKGTLVGFNFAFMAISWVKTKILLVGGKKSKLAGIVCRRT